MKKIFIILSVLLIVGSLLFSFKFQLSYYKLYLSILEIFDSFKLLLNDLFKLNLPVKEEFFNFENLVFEIKFPCTWNEFSSYVSDICSFIFTKQTFNYYLKDFLHFLLMVLYFSLIFIPIIMLVYMLIKQYYFTENDLPANCESKPLTIFKKTYVNFYVKLISFVISFKNFLLESKVFLIIIVAIWMMYFNVYSIILEFFSFYFVLIATLELSTIYTFVYRVLICLVPFFEFVPGWCL